jgi:23S rRNA pseudouridine955/2504/2580 synthase
LGGGWWALRAWLRKDAEKAQVRVFESERPGTKEILTNYRVLAQRGGFSLLEIELRTGRTHQIRAQFAALGNALVGDGKYAPRAQYQSDPFRRQCLCAYRLVFDFSTPAGCLEALNGLEVTSHEAPFVRELFPEIGVFGGISPKLP